MSITQTPDRAHGETAAEASPSYAGDRIDGEHVHTHPCPICAAHIDPVTGNPRYNAETLAAFEEAKAIMRGEIPVEWHKPEELEKVWQDLLNEETDG